MIQREHGYGLRFRPFGVRDRIISIQRLPSEQGRKGPVQHYDEAKEGSGETRQTWPHAAAHHIRGDKVTAGCGTWMIFMYKAVPGMDQVWGTNRK